MEQTSGTQDIMSTPPPQEAPLDGNEVQNEPPTMPNGPDHHATRDKSRILLLLSRSSWWGHSTGIGADTNSHTHCHSRIKNLREKLNSPVDKTLCFHA
jgi:hypothetical protein